MRRKKVVDPMTARVLRALFWASRPLTRAELIRRTRASAATEITRPVRDWRKRGLSVPCTPNAAGRPAYWLTEADRRRVVMNFADVVRRAA